MRLAVVVLVLNEETHLPTLLESLATQTRLPDELLLVDDGSTDASPELAAAWAERHGYATALRRPSRPPSRDRLARAAELAAFVWGIAQLDASFEVVVKLDSDLRLTPTCFAEVMDALDGDPRLGIAGPYLCIEGPNGEPLRERCPPYHVRGATKFYRRACLEQIYPLPEALGWDTLDDLRARMHGWRTASLSVTTGDPVHLRPTSTHDGRLRGHRRIGMAAYGYGASPLMVAAGTVRRLAQPPRFAGGLAFLIGWTAAALRRQPRPTRSERAFLHREERQRLAALASARLRRRPGRA